MEQTCSVLIAKSSNLSVLGSIKRLQVRFFKMVQNNQRHPSLEKEFLLKDL